MASYEQELRTVPFRRWAKENNIEANSIKVLERNGVKTLEDIMRLRPNDLKEAGLNVAERRRLEAALKPYWGGVAGPDDLPADLRNELSKKLRIQKKNIGLDSVISIDLSDEEVEEVVEATPAVHEEPVCPAACMESVLRLLPVIKKGPPMVYKLPVQETSRCAQLNVRKCEFGERNDVIPEKSILMIGETGSGKSTMINAMVNYLLGVRFMEDNFRFEAIDTMGEESPYTRKMTDSQTDWVTTYTIHYQQGFRLPCTLNIVDTPGYGDTRGMDRDRKITDQIKELFKSREQYGLDKLDAVCIVMKSSSNRITLSQKYIIESVLTLFGKDVEDNIFIMMTFCDDTTNPVLLNVLKDQKVPYTDFYALNNLWLTVPSSDLLGNYYWEMADKAFGDFFQYLQTSHPKSLTMTVEVMQERRELEECVEGLTRLISSTTGQLTNADQYRRTLAPTRQASTKTTDSIFAKQEQSGTNQNNLNCLSCKTTCKLNCGMFSRLAKKLERKAVKCPVCNCEAAAHKMRKWKYQWVKSKQVEIFVQREGTYDVMLSDLDKYQKDQTHKLQAQVDRLQTKISRLHEIALRPQLQNTGQYLDVVIRKEQMEKKPGYEERVKLMESLKGKYALIAKIGQKPDIDYNDLLRH